MRHWGPAKGLRWWRRGWGAWRASGSIAKRLLKQPGGFSWTCSTEGPAPLAIYSRAPSFQVSRTLLDSPSPPQLAKSAKVKVSAALSVLLALGFARTWSFFFLRLHRYHFSPWTPLLKPDHIERFFTLVNLLVHGSNGGVCSRLAQGDLNQRGGKHERFRSWIRCTQLGSYSTVGVLMRWSTPPPESPSSTTIIEWCSSPHKFFLFLFLAAALSRREIFRGQLFQLRNRESPNIQRRWEGLS